MRIIAATNQDLEELIARKKFREDLYYRLNVVTIYLPELRERKDDIPVLVKHFLDKFNRKHHKNVLSVNKDAMIALTEYDWPGNVRELENIIERAIILCEGREILSSDLPPVLVGKGMGIVIDEKGLDFKTAVNNYKRRLIIQALKNTNGIQSKAAKQLGIGRSTLNELIKNFNLTNN